jgi:DNA repair ATPase RecN
MSLSDQNKNLQEVLDASKKAIIRADEALSKYKNIFDNTEIDPEKLMHYLKKNYGPQVEKDIDEAVNDLMEDIFQEADQIIQHNKQIKKNTLVHRRLRNLI